MITRPAHATDAPAVAALVSQFGYEAAEAEVTARLGYKSVKTQYSFVKLFDEPGETLAARLMPRVDSTP